MTSLVDESRRDYLKYVVGGAALGAGALGAYYLWPREEPTPPTERSIKIGHSSCFTGFGAFWETICALQYNLWTERLNAEGGIYVEEYGQKLPVTWVHYNDMFDPGKLIRNVRKLITEDEVDVIVGSYGTAQSFAVEPIINEYDTLYFASNAGPALIEDPAEFERLYLEDDVYRDDAGNPWTEWEYAVWQETHRYHHMEALYNVLDECGVSDVVIWEIGTLYGIESRRTLERLLTYNGIDILSKKEYPWDIADFSSMIIEAEGLNPDAVLQFGYPDDCIIAIGNMIERDYNPNLYYSSLGPTTQTSLTKYGNNLEGIMGHGACYPAAPASKYGTMSGSEQVDVYIDKYDEVPDVIDGALAFAAPQVLEEIIRRAGTLDKEALHDEILKTKDNPIQTVIGPIAHVRGPWTDTPGTVSQKIDVATKPRGHADEIVGAALGDHAGLGLSWNVADYVTHSPVYPKPRWTR